MAKDFYSLLGVNKDASKDDLQNAYKVMAMRYHPDRNKNSDAEDKFKEVQRAYSVLSDDQQRAVYDQYGEAGINGQHSQEFDSSGFQDIFDNLFRGAGFSDSFAFGGRGPSSDAVFRGNDIRTRISLDLEDAVNGCKRKLKVSGMSPCDGCKGSGMDKDSKKTSCNNCGGSGVVRKQVALFSLQETCRSCGGTGSRIIDPCKTCSGSGKKRKTRVVEVDIPAGVDTNDVVRVSGEGEPGKPGGGSGDLLVEILINEHELFTRRGDDLWCELHIMLTSAILGGKVKIPTLDSYISYDLPKGMQHGKVLRLPGKGVRGVRSGRRGDLNAQIRIETPTNLTSEQTKLVRQLDKTLEANPAKHTPRRESWSQRAKKLFS